MKSTIVRVRAACLAVVMAFAFVFSGCASVDGPKTQLPMRQLTVDEAYKELLSIGVFAFGGVGFAGTTSKGEICIRTIAASTNSVELYKAIMTSTNTTAKLYALAGLRKQAPQIFEQYAKPLRLDKTVVGTMEGCFLDNEHVSNLVTKIARGSYDRYFDSPLSKQ